MNPFNRWLASLNFRELTAFTAGLMVGARRKEGRDQVRQFSWDEVDRYIEQFGFVASEEAAKGDSDV
jgi:hypothetical protein